MRGERGDPAENPDAITPGEYTFLIVWVACLVFLYVAGGFFAVEMLRHYATESARSRQAKIESPSVDLNAEGADLRVPSGMKPVDVLVGGSVNRVGDFDLKQAGWTVDFDLWFTWHGDEIDPGKSFRVVNGRTLRREEGESYKSGTEHYAEYHVLARMTIPFEGLRFPFGEEGLFVQVEDAVHGADTLRYVTDKRDSGVAREAIPPGIGLANFLALTKIGSHRSGRGEPNPAGGKSEVRSQFILAMLVVPEGWGIYQKMFQALFASVAVALIALFIKPTYVDSRFGLPVGRFLRQRVQQHLRRHAPAPCGQAHTYGHGQQGEPAHHISSSLPSR